VEVIAVDAIGVANTVIERVAERASPHIAAWKS
jgi:hypothetical protein